MAAIFVVRHAQRTCCGIDENIITYVVPKDRCNLNLESIELSREKR